MVFGRHHHIFLARCLGKLCPSARRIGCRLEALGELLVFGDGNAFFLHGPLVPAQDAVKAPVNEHAEAGFVPPLHPASAIGFSQVGRSLGLILWCPGLAQCSSRVRSSRERD